MKEQKLKRFRRKIRIGPEQEAAHMAGDLWWPDLGPRRPGGGRWADLASGPADRRPAAREA